MRNRTIGCVLREQKYMPGCLDVDDEGPRMWVMGLTMLPQDINEINFNIYARNGADMSMKRDMPASLRADLVNASNAFFVAMGLGDVFQISDPVKPPKAASSPDLQVPEPAVPLKSAIEITATTDMPMDVESSRSAAFAGKSPSASVLIVSPADSACSPVVPSESQIVPATSLASALIAAAETEPTAAAVHCVYGPSTTAPPVIPINSSAGPAAVPSIAGPAAVPINSATGPAAVPINSATGPAAVPINLATGAAAVPINSAGEPAPVSLSAAETIKCPIRTDPNLRMDLVLKLLSSFYWHGYSTSKIDGEHTVWQMARFYFTADSRQDSGAQEDLKGSVRGDGSSHWYKHIIPFTLHGTFHIRWLPPSIVMKTVKQHPGAFANEIPYEMTLTPDNLAPGNDWSGIDLAESTVKSIEPFLILRPHAHPSTAAAIQPPGSTRSLNGAGVSNPTEISIAPKLKAAKSYGESVDSQLDMQLKAVKSHVANLDIQSKELDAEIAELDATLKKCKASISALPNRDSTAPASNPDSSGSSGTSDPNRIPSRVTDGAEAHSSIALTRPVTGPTGRRSWILLIPVLLCFLISATHVLISRISVLEQHQHLNSQDQHVNSQNQLKMQVRLDRLERERGALSDNLLLFTRNLLSAIEPSPEIIPTWLNAKIDGSQVLNPAPNASVLNPLPVRLEACTGVHAWWTTGLTDRGDRFLPGPGWRLLPGEFLRTTDCLRYLVMQNDCNLVMYIPGPAVGRSQQLVWESGTAVAEPHGPCSASFVLGRRFHRVYVCLPGVDCKATGLHMPVLDGDVPTGLLLSHGFTGPLSLSPVFDEPPLPPLTLKDSSSAPKALSTPSNPLEPCNGLRAKGLVDRGDRLLPGPWHLSRGEYIRTPDCSHYALMQDDCNLVIYRAPLDGYNGMGSAIWASQTQRREAHKPWPKCRAFLRVVHPIATDSLLYVCDDVKCSDPVFRLDHAKVAGLVIWPKEQTFAGIF